jgi:serine/threonine-protein phosphatase 2A regulatory subunit A
MVTELIDKIDSNPELMLNLAEQLGKLSDFLGSDHNSIYLLKPLELILSSDDSVVREKAVASLKIVGERINDEAIYSDYMPLVKKMRKGDLFSMRISACFLYAHIYRRLDSERKQYARKKFEKLVKDDTPMVRRGAAQSLSILSDCLNDAELAKSWLLPQLKALLQDDNDSVKIQAVGASAKVARLIQDSETVRTEIVPPLRAAVDNKMVSWRLRFSVAEVAAELAGHVPREIADTDVIGYYVSLLQDKEPEVRSEAVAKLPTLAKNCSPNEIVEKILPVLNTYTVNDASQHVKGSLALAICELS